MRHKFHIKPQRYPCHDGSRPLSWAIYSGRVFLAYNWSLSGAWRALWLIREGMDQQRITG